MVILNRFNQIAKIYVMVQHRYLRFTYIICNIQSNIILVLLNKYLIKDPTIRMKNFHSIDRTTEKLSA